MTEEKITPEQQRKLIFKFDVPAIRAEMVRLLARPKCATFVREVLLRVSQGAGSNNKLVANGDVLKVFDIIVNEQKGLVRAGDTVNGAIGGANFASGSIQAKDARIQVGNCTTGVPVTMAELAKMYVESDARICIHETLHHCGELVYNDEVYAIAVSMMNGNVTPVPPPTVVDKRFWFSDFWDKELRKTYN